MVKCKIENGLREPAGMMSDLVTFVQEIIINDLCTIYNLT